MQEVTPVDPRNSRAPAGENIIKLCGAFRRSPVPYRDSCHRRGTTDRAQGAARSRSARVARLAKATKRSCGRLHNCPASAMTLCPLSARLCSRTLGRLLRPLLRPHLCSTTCLCLHPKADATRGDAAPRGPQQLTRRCGVLNTSQLHTAAAARTPSNSATYTARNDGHLASRVASHPPSASECPRP